MILGDWLAVLALGVILVIVPGPNFVMTLRNSLVISRRAGLLTALGIALGGTTHVAYSLLGIGALIAQSITLFNALKWLGTVYLLILGIKALRARPHPPQIADSAPITANRAPLKNGYLTCLLNPKSTLFFFALFTQVVEPETPFAARVVYGLTIVFLELIWYSFVALVISQPAIQGRISPGLHWLERISGVVLVGLGIRLARQEMG